VIRKARKIVSPSEWYEYAPMGEAGRVWMKQDFSAECYREWFIELYSQMGVVA
jgi:hypothetical protein